MRLMTHNYLQSSVNRTKNGYPLRIEASKIIIDPSPFNRELLSHMLTRINYNILLSAIEQIKPQCPEDFTIPDLPPTIDLTKEGVDILNDDTLSTLQLVLMDIYVEEGKLICPDSGRKFSISGGIPNMLLHEDEI